MFSKLYTNRNIIHEIQKFNCRVKDLDRDKFQEENTLLKKLQYYILNDKMTL